MPSHTKTYRKSHLKNQVMYHYNGPVFVRTVTNLCERTKLCSC